MDFNPTLVKFFNPKPFTKSVKLNPIWYNCVAVYPAYFNSNTLNPVPFTYNCDKENNSDCFNVYAALLRFDDCKAAFNISKLLSADRADAG